MSTAWRSCCFAAACALRDRTRSRSSSRCRCADDKVLLELQVWRVDSKGWASINTVEGAIAAALHGPWILHGPTEQASCEYTKPASGLQTIDMSVTIYLGCSRAVNLSRRLSGEGCC